MESKTVNYLTGFIALLEHELELVKQRAKDEDTEVKRLTDIIRSYKEELKGIKVKPQPQPQPQPQSRFDADEERRKERIRKGQEFNAKRTEFQKWLDEQDANKAAEQKENAKPNPQHQDDAWFQEDVRQQEERFRQQREAFQDDEYDWRKNPIIESEMRDNYVNFMTIVGFDIRDFPDMLNLELWYAHFRKRWPELKKAYYKWLQRNKAAHIQRHGEKSDELTKVMNGIFSHINIKLFPGVSTLSSILRLMHQRVTLLEAAMRSSH